VQCNFYDIEKYIINIDCVTAKYREIPPMVSEELDLTTKNTNTNYPSTARPNDTRGTPF